MPCRRQCLENTRKFIKNWFGFRIPFWDNLICEQRICQRLRCDAVGFDIICCRFALSNQIYLKQSLACEQYGVVNVFIFCWTYCYWLFFSCHFFRYSFRAQFIYVYFFYFFLSIWHFFVVVTVNGNLQLGLDWTNTKYVSFRGAFLGIMQLQWKVIEKQ